MSENCPVAPTIKVLYGHTNLEESQGALFPHQTFPFHFRFGAILSTPPLPPFKNEKGLKSWFAIASLAYYTYRLWENLHLLKIDSQANFHTQSFFFRWGTHLICHFCPSIHPSVCLSQTIILQPYILLS